MKRKLKVGICGYGCAARYMHTPEILLFPEYFDITAICDKDLERLTNLPEGLGDIKKYEKMEDMFADPQIDMITIATRNADHTPHAIQALEAGKYVVIEKPIAVSYEQARELKKASEKFPGKLFLRFNRRFEPAFNHVRELIASDIIGNVNMVKVYRHPGYVRRLDWQTLSSCKGGMLNNWGPHLIDQALQFLDSPVEDLWCDLQHNVALGDADDQVKIILRGTNKRAEVCT